MKLIIFTLILCGLTSTLLAQGCSDAGFCSIGPLKQVNKPTQENHSLDIGTNIGIGEENTFTINPYVQYNHSFNSRFAVLGKLTATYAQGFLGHSFSPGDFFAAAIYKLKNTNSAHALKVVGGVKIPFTSANQKSKTGGALPLDYQASLGTYDVILGINYSLHQHWEFSAGWQTPVVHQNKNTFFPDEYTDERAKSFAPTNYFKRKSDVLLRAGYHFGAGKRFMVTPGLLAIYHTGNDTYENRFGNREILQGSKGLTLNGTLAASKYFNNKTSLELLVATPFIVREVRADGLTRSLVANIQYSIPF